jgi:quercetin dioxygenase-like cupin family protein
MGRIVLTAMLVAFAFATSPISAQQHQTPRGKPTPLFAPSDITGVPGHQLRAIHNDFVAGAGTPRHVHPGDQWTIVELGEVTMIINDGEPKLMKVGDMIRIPAGTPHETYNRTDKPARTLELFVLEKDKPNITMMPK